MAKIKSKMKIVIAIEDIDGDNEDDEPEMDVEPPSPKVKSFNEPVVALEDVSQFWRVVDISRHIVCWGQ